MLFAMCFIITTLIDPFVSNHLYLNVLAFSTSDNFNIGGSMIRRLPHRVRIHYRHQQHHYHNYECFRFRGGGGIAMNDENDCGQGINESSLLNSSGRRKKTIMNLASSSDDADVENNNNDEPASSSSLLPYLPILLPLLLIYISQQWARSSIYYLVNFSSQDSFTAANVDLNFDESQYGILASVAFVALFATASPLAGSLADRMDRRLLLILPCLAWSILCIASYFAPNYEFLLGARILTGLACAFTVPAAYTTIRDAVPDDRRALANSVLGSGVYLGGSLSSLGLLLNGNIGWRGTEVAVGLFGLVVAGVAALTLPPDEANRMKREREEKIENEKAPSLSSSSSSSSSSSQSISIGIADILSSPPARWILLAGLLRFGSGLTIGVWSASYFRLAFPSFTDAASSAALANAAVIPTTLFGIVLSYATVNAFIVGPVGALSNLMGGYLADIAGAATVTMSDPRTLSSISRSSLSPPPLLSSYTKRRIEASGRLIVPVIGSLLAVPLWYLTVHATTFESSMIYLAAEYLVAECWFGPTVASLQTFAGPERGGLAQGLFTLSGALGNLAPTVLGILYGSATAATTVEGGNVAILSNLLGNAVCAGYLLSAVCFTFAALTGMTAAMEEEPEEIVNK